MFARRVLTAATSVALFVGLSTAVQAGGEVSMKDDPAPAKTYVWDGLYVAAGVGAGSFDFAGKVTKLHKKWKRYRQTPCYWFDHGWCHVSDDPFDHPSDGSDWDWSGVTPTAWSHKRTFYDKLKFADDDWHGFGTIQVGYDRLLHNRFLIGVFADYDFYKDSDVKFKGGKRDYIHAKVELEDMFHIGGRLGFLLTPRIALYGVGGYAEADINSSAYVNFKYGPDLYYKGPDDMSGHFYGAGAELKLHDKLSLKIEWRKTDLDSERTSKSKTTYSSWYDKSGYCGPQDTDCKQKQYKTTNSSKFDLDAEIQSIRASLVLKLGNVHHREPVEPLK